MVIFHSYVSLPEAIPRSSLDILRGFAMGRFPRIHGFIGTPMKRTAPNDTEKPGRFVMQHDDHSVFAPGLKNIDFYWRTAIDFRRNHRWNSIAIDAPWFPAVHPPNSLGFLHPSPSKTGWWLTYPSEKNWTLGWWHSQYMGKSWTKIHGSKAPSSGYSCGL